MADDVRLWSTERGGVAPVVLRAGDEPLSDAVFSPDGRRVLTIGRTSRRLRVHPVDGLGATVNLDGRANAQAVAFSPDGRWIAASYTFDGIYLFRADGSRDSVRHAAVLKGNLVRRVAFSADGRRLLVPHDRRVLVWPLAGDSTYDVAGHTADVADAAFSPDGSRIVTASRDGTVRVGNTDGNGEALIITAPDESDHATFSPDGRRLLTAGHSASVRLLAWDDVIASLARATAKLCLSEAKRHAFLGESARVAHERWQACERAHHGSESLGTR